MKKHRVLVVDEDSVFSNGIKLLLVLQESLEIIGKTPANIQQIATRLEQTRPDVVVISDEFGATQPQFVLEMLTRYPTLRVVVFSQMGNRVNIINNREIIVESAADLIAAITSNNIIS
ncbi:MAG: hypothetical protein FOGNACKC_05324 [Anaerolineae bacterium]|nr:hypothetical protein [Anaerolineae bacterium]